LGRGGDEGPGDGASEEVEDAGDDGMERTSRRPREGSGGLEAGVARMAGERCGLDWVGG